MSRRITSHIKSVCNMSAHGGSGRGVRDHQPASQSGKSGWCLRAVRCPRHAHAYIVEELADRDLPITVYASPAAQALQQEISEHSVAAAPLRAFTREFVRSAGGNDGTMFPVTQGAPAFVRHVRPGFSDSAAVACVDETYGIRLECALESDLQVPHRDGGAAK